MAERLEKPGLLIVSGASGVGKSSLLQAGLLPALAAGACSANGSAAWPRALIMPGRHPMSELAIKIASMAGVDTRTHLLADPTRITSAIRQALSANGARYAKTPGLNPQADLDPDQLADEPDTNSPTATRQTAATPRLVIIVDQFEELFTLCSDEQERRTFIKALCAAANLTEAEPAQAPPALVVLAVRADFESHCAAYPDLASGVQDRYLVQPMTRSGLRQAIAGPAMATGFHIQDGLVDILLRDAAELPSALVLPLLSYALDQTWRGRSGPNLTIADYQRAGGIDRAVAFSAEIIFDHLSPSQQAMARGLFMKLIVISEDGMQTSHSVRIEELTASMPVGQAHDLQATIDTLAAARLLILKVDTVAISQPEILLSAWPRLDYWLTEFRVDLIVRNRLSTDAAEWMRSGQDPAYLYKGTRLEIAQEVADRIGIYQLPLSAGEHDFLQAGMRNRRRSMRRRRILTVLMLVLIVGLAAETFFLIVR